MGALKGSMSVRRYAVTDPLPSEARRKLMKGLRAHVFVPIEPQSDVERSFGWVNLEDSEDLELDTQNTLFVASGGEQLRVSMRVDTLKPSAAEVRRQLLTRVRAIEAEQGRPVRKREKAELKTEITRKLRLRSFPTVRTFDVVWNLDTGRLYLWSQGKTINELFVDLFTRSFSMRLGLEGPSVWARNAVDEAVLSRLEPTPELHAGFSGVRPLTSGIVEAA